MTLYILGVYIYIYILWIQEYIIYILCVFQLARKILRQRRRKPDFHHARRFFLPRMLAIVSAEPGQGLDDGFLSLFGFVGLGCICSQTLASKFFFYNSLYFAAERNMHRGPLDHGPSKRGSANRKYSTIVKHLVALQIFKQLSVLWQWVAKS